MSYPYGNSFTGDLLDNGSDSGSDSEGSRRHQSGHPGYPSYPTDASGPGYGTSYRASYRGYSAAPSSHARPSGYPSSHARPSGYDYGAGPYGRGYKHRADPGRSTNAYTAPSASSTSSGSGRRRRDDDDDDDISARMSGIDPRTGEPVTTSGWKPGDQIMGPGLVSGPGLSRRAGARARGMASKTSASSTSSSANSTSRAIPLRPARANHMRGPSTTTTGPDGSASEFGAIVEEEEEENEEEAQEAPGERGGDNDDARGQRRGRSLYR